MVQKARFSETEEPFFGANVNGSQRAREAPERTAQGFSLVELLIVTLVILIIAAVAIPSFLRARVTANESSAVSSVRQINTAEGTYSSSWGSGYAETLANLGGPTPCLAGTAAAACLIDPLLSTGTFTKSGYVFNEAGTQLVNGSFNGYEVNATPGTLQITGVRAFCSDATGVIKFVIPGAAPIGVAAGSCAAVATVAGVSGPVGN